MNTGAEAAVVLRSRLLAGAPHEARAGSAADLEELLRQIEDRAALVRLAADRAAAERNVVARLMAPLLQERDEGSGYGFVWMNAHPPGR